MRRDIGHFYAADIQTVFNAYLRAAKEKLGRSCSSTPYHSVQFGIGMSFRYNMNGGACNIHLMPSNGGTAVCVRYSIVQLAGARYEAYDKALTEAVESVLGIRCTPCSLPMEQFEDYAASGAQPAPPVTPPPVASPTAQPAPEINFCSRCGARVKGGNFCSQCGNKLI